uniref:DDE Tnp4 domain-containing protein n=1 Tax=Amphimedon queenslandica TaxID=400682 RepID=A0A1X7VWW9_AMPQE
DGICSNPEVELSEVESSSSPAILPTYESNEETMPLNFPEQLSKSSDDGLFKNDQFGMSAAGSMFGDESDMVADSMLLNDCHVADMDQVSELVTEYEYEIGELQVKNETLNDKKLFDILVPFVNKDTTSKLPLIANVFGTLAKLSLGLLNKNIAYCLNISEAKFSTIFHCWLDYVIHENLPQCFKKHAAAVCIADCIKIFIQQPVSLSAQAATYSNYKKHNTVKVLIAATPTGLICFLSKAWGAKVSDKVITQQSGFLKHIWYGDVVLADRGFNVSEDLAVLGTCLKISAFTKGKKQLTQKEVETRQLAWSCIHIERVIGQLRNIKF